MKISVFAATMVALSTGTAAAGTLEDIIASLQSDGFTVTEVDKTFLGNYKIEASKGSVEREVVYSPFYDKILRDRTDDEVDDHSGEKSASNSSRDDDGHESGEDGSDHDGDDHDSGDHDSGDHDSGDHDSGDHDSGDHEGGGDD